MQRLIDQMNFIANLEIQLQNLPPQDTARRAQLFDEINSTLASVDAQAIQLETIASQRTYMDHVITYSTGMIGAILGTMAYYFGLLLYMQYRIRRTLRMKIIPK